jgi:hypothetical protein
MSGRHGTAVCGRAAGNLVRLVYLDEAGTSGTATSLAVAGIIVHGDRQWAQVDARVREVIEKWIPADDRLEFVFHATDIFHGSRYFDRNKAEWRDRDRRWAVLTDLAQILADFGLPVVVGTYDKSRMQIEGDQLREVSQRSEDLHLVAAIDCLYWADLWLALNAPDEHAAVVHEDGPEAKAAIKRVLRLMRYPDLLADWPDGHNPADIYALPFNHIVDTVHFAEKADARLLQLADLCAFMIGRAVQNRSVPPAPMRIILERVDWIKQMQGRPGALFSALQGLSGGNYIVDKHGT